MGGEQGAPRLFLFRHAKAIRSKPANALHMSAIGPKRTIGFNANERRYSDVPSARMLPLRPI
jgi:hypothetical protein